ncbi:MAG: FAD-binding oxidoreductase [Nocardioides sp.]|uniref:FAD-binding oxidoreductase n=1 Tax=Nocardioides sp. TaxID=35761 RepID=UPI003F0CC76F
MSHLAEASLGLSTDRISRLVGDLADDCPGFVHLPGSPGYDSGRFAWNVAVDQRPAAVGAPGTVEELSRLVRSARRHGLRLTTQATGHAASVLAQHDLTDVVLVRTGALRGVHVDPVNRVARVEAGACWQDVIDVAAAHGLTALHGSAPDVGVVGYTLGGGLSWYARSHGLAANSVVGVELVDAHGEVVRADAHTREDLFWGLRGGGGNFGIVTTIEVALLPIPDVYAGMLTWDVAHAEEVLRTFVAWSGSAPEEVTASCRIMRFPPFPELPDFLRGRSLVVLDAAVLLDDAAAVELLAPFRALGPELDTFARVPSSALTGLHMDPPEPSPGVADGIVLETVDVDTLTVLLDHVGAGARTGIFVAELRQLGGALARTAPGAGALDHVPGSHVVFFLAMAPTPEAAAGAEREIASVLEALAPWHGRRLLNFADSGGDAGRAFDRTAWQRLRELKAEVDAEGLFLGHHSVPATAGD